jgi:DNA-binding winged helix-turn-helix (wHTH) protein
VNFSTQTQSIAILQALLEHPGELVTREALRDRLWGPDTFVDYEAGLNAAVRRLREALNDSADTPRYVETLPRRGYRFIAPVDVASTTRKPRHRVRLPPTRTRSFRRMADTSTTRSRCRWRVSRSRARGRPEIQVIDRGRSLASDVADSGIFITDASAKPRATRHGSAAPAGLRIPAGPYLNVTCDGRSMLYVRYDQWTSDIEMVRGIR